MTEDDYEIPAWAEPLVWAVLAVLAGILVLA